MQRTSSQSVTQRRRLAILALAVVAALGLLAVFNAGGATAGAANNAGLGSAGALLAQAGDGPTGPESVTATCPPGGQCFADVVASNPFYSNINNLYMQDIVGGYACGGAGEPCDSANRPYFRWGNTVTRGQLSKFVDNARSMPGMVISTTSTLVPITVIDRSTGAGPTVYSESLNGTAIWGVAKRAPEAGVYGVNDAGHGVWGRAFTTNYGAVYGQGLGTAHGVYGYSATRNGVYGTSAGSSAAIFGEATGSGNGILATSSGGQGVVGLVPGGSGRYALYASGDLRVTGVCDGCALATYKIDHPADPANMYLNQAAVVSNELLNVYNGNVTLNARGEARVTLPAWFEAVNKDYRYQLTAVGAPGAGLYISEEIKGGAFKISGGTPGGKVSWQVSGVRHDRVAEANPLTVEQEKPAAEKGTYWSPGLYDQPDSKGIGATLKP